MQKLYLNEERKKSYEDLLNGFLKKESSRFIGYFTIYLIWDYAPEDKKFGLSREDFFEKKISKLALELDYWFTLLENVNNGFILI